MILLIVLIVLVGSFLCSLLEAVLLSINSAFTKIAMKKGKKYGELLDAQIHSPERPLAAILTVNTAINTMGSAYIGFLVQKQFGDSAVTLAVIGLTIFILIFSEILPKAIGATHWKSLAPFAAFLIQVMIWITLPFVFLSQLVRRKLVSETEHPEVSREEMIETAEIGAEEGSIKRKESLVIKNLLMLDKIFVSDIMTPRSVFFALEADETVEEVSKKYRPIRYSRVPVYNGNLDNIIGMTHRYKILDELTHEGEQKKILELVSPIATVSERLTVSQVIDFFIKQKEHLALAADEYGVVTGLVTLEDAIETLLGVEIVDEFDSHEDLRKYALEQWALRKQRLKKDNA